MNKNEMKKVDRDIEDIIFNFLDRRASDKVYLCENELDVLKVDSYVHEFIENTSVYMSIDRMIDFYKDKVSFYQLKKENNYMI